MSKIEREHISYSEWQLWNLCQHRWMLEVLEGKRIEEHSVYLVFGAAIHDALETAKDPELKDCRPSVDEICQTFDEKFRSSYLSIRGKDKKPLTDEEIDEFAEAGIRIIRNIDECLEIREATVLFVEYKLYENIERTDDVKIKFKGYIDLVIKSKNKRGKTILWIIDYKTCSWGWSLEEKQDEMKAAQIRLYKHFFSKKFNLNPKDVRTAFVLLKRVPRKENEVVEWLPISSGEKTVMRAVLKINQAITGMRSNSYKKNRNSCISPFGDECPHMNTERCTKD